MLSKFAASFAGLFSWSCGGTVSLIFLDAHQVSESCSSHVSSLLSLLLAFLLLPLLLDYLAAFATEHCHVTLRVKHCWNWFELFGEDGPAIQKRWLQVMYQQMYSRSIVIVLEVYRMISSLGHAGSQHSIRFPGVNIFLLLGCFCCHPLVEFSVCQSSLLLLIRPCVIYAPKRIVCLVPEGVTKFIPSVPVSVQSIGFLVRDKWFSSIRSVLHRRGGIANSTRRR